MASTNTPRATTSPPALLAVAIAARRTGDRELERAALRELRDAHGLRLTFCRTARREVAHA